MGFCEADLGIVVDVCMCHITLFQVNNKLILTEVMKKVFYIYYVSIFMQCSISDLFLCRKNETVWSAYMIVEVYSIWLVT